MRHPKQFVVLIAAGAFLFTAACAKRKHIAAVPRAVPPQAAPLTSEQGIASWYGHPYHGRPAANGEIYDMDKLTAAHRTLPFDTWVRVTNLTNGKNVDVRITDRGPFIDGRIIDLSRAAARSIDLIGPGTALVRLDVLSSPAVVLASGYAVQIGAFRDRTRAERLRASMQERFGAARIVERPGNPLLYRVLVGDKATPADAAALASSLRAEVGAVFVVRLDNAPVRASVGTAGR